MRIDLCRRCGSEMGVSVRCDICHGANEFLCSECGAASQKQVHLPCILISLHYALLGAGAA